MTNKEIIDNLNNLTSEEEAKRLLTQLDKPTIEELRAFENKLSTIDPTAGAHAITVTYSGNMYSGEGFYYGANDEARIWKELDPEGIRIIDKTVAGKVLASDVYQDALDSVLEYHMEDTIKFMSENENLSKGLLEKFGVTDIKDIPLDKIKEIKNVYLYNATDVPWGKASAKFMRETTGDVMGIMPNAGSARTWWLVEFPQYLEDSSAGKFFGLTREEWKNELEFVKKEFKCSDETAMDMIRNKAKHNSGIFLNQYDLSHVDLFYGPNDKGYIVLKEIDASRVTGKLFEGKIGGLTKKSVEEMRQKVLDENISKLYKNIENLDSLGLKDKYTVSSYLDILKYKPKSPRSGLLDDEVNSIKKIIENIMENNKTSQAFDDLISAKVAEYGVNPLSDCF